MERIFRWHSITVRLTVELPGLLPGICGITPIIISFDQPGQDIADKPVIIVDQKNFDSIKPIVGTNYIQVSYIRMVWPNQDYFNLSWDRFKGALLDPSLRSAIWQIWLNRDFSQYAKISSENGLTNHIMEPE